MMSYFIVIGVVLRVLLPAWLMDRLFGVFASSCHLVRQDDCFRGKETE